MPNSFILPEHAATVAAKLLAEDAPLASLVSHNYQEEFLGQGRGGAPIAIKQPTTLGAHERDIDDITTALTLDTVTETFTTINLDRVMDYSAVVLTEGDLNLRLNDFAAQVLAPQTAAVADAIEAKLARALLAVPETVVAYDEAKPVSTFTALRKLLRENGVPQQGIQVVVGTDVYAALLESGAITTVSESGSDGALREANVGRVRGFTVVESTRVDEGRILAFHRDAVTLVTRAPAVPKGAAWGATTSEAGFSLRVLRDYDAMTTADRSIVATFSGVGILPTYKVVRNAQGVRTGVIALPNGGVINVDTAV